MRDLPPELLATPFTRAQAAEHGISDTVLQGRRLRRLHRGVFIGADVPDSPELWRAAALLAVPDGVLSHETAASVHRLPLPLRGPGVQAPDGVHLSVEAPRKAPRVDGLIGHQAAWQRGDVVTVGGLRVTSVPRTWCDLAASGWSREDLVAAGDAVLRRWTAPGRRALEDRVDRWDARRQVRLLREALALSAFRVDSPMETRLRLLLLDAGLPAPLVNEPIRDVDRTPLHTPDLSWPQWRYAIDYDGAHHFRYDDPSDVAARRRDDWRRRHDIGRQEFLREIGWVLTVVTSHDVLNDADRLVERARRQLRERGAPC